MFKICKNTWLKYSTQVCARDNYYTFTDSFVLRALCCNLLIHFLTFLAVLHLIIKVKQLCRLYAWRNSHWKWLNNCLSAYQVFSLLWDPSPVKPFSNSPPRLCHPEVTCSRITVTWLENSLLLLDVQYHFHSPSLPLQKDFALVKFECCSSLSNCSLLLFW